MKKLFLAAAVAVSLVGGAAFADDPAQDIWTAKCKSCHGPDGKADTKEGKKHKIDDMTQAEWQSKHTDADIRKVISEGKADTKMKAYKDKLSAGEIDSLVKYIRTLK